VTVWAPTRNPITGFIISQPSLRQSAHIVLMTTYRTNSAPLLKNAAVGMGWTCVGVWAPHRLSTAPLVESYWDQSKQFAWTWATDRSYFVMPVLESITNWPYAFGTANPNPPNIEADQDDALDDPYGEPNEL